MSTLLVLILLAHFHLVGIVIAGLLLSVIIMFAAIALIAGTQAFFSAQDHFFDWATKKIARDGSWQRTVDNLLIGGMALIGGIVLIGGMVMKLAH